MYGDVVLGLKPQGKEIDPFEAILEAKKHARGVQLDTELPAAALKELVVEFKAAILQKNRACSSPTTPGSSSGAPSAPSSAPGRTRAPITYRAHVRASPTAGAPPSTCRRWSSATSATTAPPASRFTRDPSTGEQRFYGEYLVNAQGEDVVAGIRTPQPDRQGARSARRESSLEELMPAAYTELDATRLQARRALPRHAGHRVHDPAGQALAAADPQRQAHRPRPWCASPSTW